MLKWIASGCLVVIVVIGVVAYAGYRKMKVIAASGPIVSVSIHAPPSRVFASMSHSDSLGAWFAPGVEMAVARHAPLAKGDTIFLTQVRRDSTARTALVIDTVVPDRLIAMRWVALATGATMYARRDSLAATDDSTLVTSTIATPLADSLAAARSRANGAAGGLLDMASTVSAAGGRMQAEQELRRLKLHIEGPPVSRP